MKMKRPTHKELTSKLKQARDWLKSSLKIIVVLGRRKSHTKKIVKVWKKQRLRGIARILASGCI